MKKKKTLTRIQNMARIKSQNTKPEIYTRKLLYKINEIQIQRKLFTASRNA